MKKTVLAFQSIQCRSKETRTDTVAGKRKKYSTKSTLGAPDRFLLANQKITWADEFVTAYNKSNFATSLIRLVSNGFAACCEEWLCLSVRWLFRLGCALVVEKALE